MDDTASTSASKSTHLFDVVRRPDGREFSNEEVATAVTDVVNRFRRLERLPSGRPNDR